MRIPTAMTPFDYEQARFNMVEQQIRTWEVLDQRVLDLLFAVKREDFVPPAYRALAFADLELPLPNGARMWTPKMEARVLQELMLADSDRVLEIGTGSGYFTALLASERRRRHERRDRRLDRGRRPRETDPARIFQRTRRRRRRRARLRPRDIRRDRADRLDAAAPRRFFEQLVPGGRVFAVVGEAPAMKARLIRWEAPGGRVATDLFETVVAPLVNAAAPARFEF